MLQLINAQMCTGLKCGKRVQVYLTTPFKESKIDETSVIFMCLGKLKNGKSVNVLVAIPKVDAYDTDSLEEIDWCGREYYAYEV